MGFLDSIKNFFTGSSGQTAPAQTSQTSDPFSFTSMSTQTSTPSYIPPKGTTSTSTAPVKFALNEVKPTPADSLGKPTTNLNQVQNAVTTATSTPATGAGFKASADKVGQVEDPSKTKDDTTSPASVREQIQQGLMSILGKDTSADKQKIREEANIEEKSKTANRVLNQLRSIRVDFEAKKDKLENENKTGRSMGAINNEINQLTKDTNRNLAYKSIEYDIANNDLQSAERTVADRIQDMKDEETKQVQLYKTLYDFVQDDMSESEKMEAQQAFAEKESERSFERSKELARYNSLLNREEASYVNSLKQAVTAQEASEASKALVPALQGKVGQLNEAISALKNGGSGNVVGTNPLARFSLTRAFTGSGQNFIANVEQLVSRETLDTLLALKAKGGTLGALSEKELMALEASASRIGTWRMKDENGNVTGYKANEKDFETELKTLRSLTNKAIVEAGGSVDEDPLGIGVGRQDPLNLGF